MAFDAKHPAVEAGERLANGEPATEIIDHLDRSELKYLIAGLGDEVGLGWDTDEVANGMYGEGSGNINRTELRALVETFGQLVYEVSEE